MRVQLETRDYGTVVSVRRGPRGFTFDVPASLCTEGRGIGHSGVGELLMVLELAINEVMKTERQPHR